MLVAYPKRFAVTPKPPSGREGDRRLTTVEGERERAFFISKQILRAEARWMRMSRTSKGTESLNESAP